MRYPAEHKGRTREEIVGAAARRFRSHGSEGTAIADLMHDLHLTHGGFYRHFDSKEELFAAAFEQSLDQLFGRIVSAAENAPPGGELRALIDCYLDIEHSKDVAGGCPVAALAAEIARRPPKAREAFLQILRRFLSRVARYIPARNEEDRERKTRLLFSGMAGTLTVARALVDESQRRRFLDDAKKFYFDAVQR